MFIQHRCSRVRFAFHVRKPRSASALLVSCGAQYRHHTHTPDRRGGTGNSTAASSPPLTSRATASPKRSLLSALFSANPPAPSRPLGASVSRKFDLQRKRSHAACDSDSAERGRRAIDSIMFTPSARTPLSSSQSPHSDRPGTVPGTSSQPHQSPAVTAISTWRPAHGSSSMVSTETRAPTPSQDAPRRPPSASRPPGPSPPVTSTLLTKLERTVRGKRVGWSALVRARPEVLGFPLYAERANWTQLYCSRGAATPPTPPPPGGPAVMICSAGTGTGKSVLVPLYLVDAHWTTLLARIHATLAGMDSANEQRGDGGREPRDGPLRGGDVLPTSDQREFVQHFSGCSRLCIVVSQPTRLACIELAKYTAELLANSTATTSASSETGAVAMGARVGYAVGGDAHFSAQSEIVFATPGYILNALQSAASTPLRPTTLIVDEAHCRDAETDLLLACLKHSRQGRSDAITPSWQLRQVVVMSATINPGAMLRYLDSRSEEGHCGSLRLPPEFMLTAAQRKTVERQCGHVRTTQIGKGRGSSGSSSAGADPSGALPHTLAVAAATLDKETNALSLEPIVCTGSPHRVERYFIEDLQAGGAFLRSDMLFGEWQSTSGVDSAEKAGRQGPSRSTEMPGWHSQGAPLLLTSDGARALESLVHFFQYTNIKTILHSAHATALATFLVQLLQTLRTSGDAPAEPSPPPASVLVFLAGFAEIQLVLQTLERMSGKDVLDQPHTSSGGTVSPSSPSTSMEPITVLRCGEEAFTVPVLHATALGSPHVQLQATGACGVPYRIILSTPVAESSLTIPNLRVVVDTCMERKFVADVLTGTTRKETCFVDCSSLRQRCGRAGRTCDGVVIHLAPRRLFGPLTTPSPSSRELEITERRGLAGSPHGGVVPLASPLPDSPATILLRVKSLFSEGASSILGCMPHPLDAVAVEAAYSALVDLQVLSPPTSAGGAAGGGGASYPPRLTALVDKSVLTARGRVVAALPVPLEQALLIYHSFQFSCVEDALLIACAMTVPALLVTPRVAARSILPPVIARDGQRNSLADRAGDAVAGTDTSLSGTTARSPLEQFYKHLWVQRHLVSAPVPGGQQRHRNDNRGGPRDSGAQPPPSGGSNSDENAVSEMASARGGHLSEPLVLRSLLLAWYTCTSPEEAFAFLRAFSINRSALRSVDIAVAQCCQRLVQLLVAEEKGSSAHEGRHGGAHVSGWENDVIEEPSEGFADRQVAEYEDFVQARGGSSSLGALIDPAWPPAYRHQLIRSLRRLRQAALDRVGHRFTKTGRGYTQWYSADQQLASMLVRHRLSALERERVSAEWAGRGGPDDDGGARQRRCAIAFGTVVDRTCAAFIAAFARHTMRGEDGGYRQHHRRLSRNHSVLQDDTDHVCTFNVEVRVPQDSWKDEEGESASASRQPSLFRSPAHAHLTPALTTTAVAAALKPYMAGTGLRQVELFMSGSTLALRFASAGFAGLFTAAELLPGGSGGGTSATNGGTHEEESAGSAGGVSEEGMSNSEASDLLAPRVLCHERAPARPAAHCASTRLHRLSDGSPQVQLAPFGVSLLVAAQSALQRLSMELRVTAPASAPPPSTSPPETGTQQTTSGGEEVAVVSTSSTRPRSGAVRLVDVRQTGECGGSGSSALDRRALWCDQYGVERQVCRRTLLPLGLDHLFPQSPQGYSAGAAALMVARRRRQWLVEEDSSVPAHRTASGGVGPESPRGHPASSVAGAVTAATTTADCVAEGGRGSSSGSGPAVVSVLLSVLNPINVTKGIYWKIGLPSVRHWGHRRGIRRHTHQSAASTPSSPSPVSSLSCFCDVCGIMCRDLRAHCRTPPHLNHLYWSVQHGITKEDWGIIWSGAPGQAERHLKSQRSDAAVAQTPALTSLLFRGGCEGGDGDWDGTAPVGPLPMLTHACRVSPHSFLNALQSRTPPEGSRGCVPPLAIAGSLISQATLPSAPTRATVAAPFRPPSGVSLPTEALSPSSASPPTSAGSSQLQEDESNGASSSHPLPGVITAHHVWVIHLGSGDDNGVAAARMQLTLAGYLAASSPQFMTSFLFNSSHTYIHGVALYDCVVWRLPEPLNVRSMDSLAFIQSGRGWPGVLRDRDDSSAIPHDSPPEGAGATRSGCGKETSAFEGLHWCVASGTCPHCTYVPTPDDPAPTYTGGGRAERAVTKEEGSADAVVATALLLSLQEYVLAQRAMVSLSDFVHRVLAKLSVAPAAGQQQDTSRGSGIDQLRGFLQRRGGQTLADILRDVGCQFVTPPAALATAQVVPRAQAVAAEGATLSMMFSPPAVLPSRLPSPHYAPFLRNFQAQARHSRKSVRDTDGTEELF